MTREGTQRLLDEALEAFTAVTGLGAQVLRREISDGNRQVDAEIEIDRCGRLLVELKPNVRHAQLGATIARLRQLPRDGILVTSYVTPGLGEELKKQGVQFMDAAGNAFLSKKGLFVFVAGRKGQPIEEGRPVRLFNAAGLKVLFALLCKDRLEQRTYRDIAKVAGVARGTVGYVMEDLARLDYLDQTENGRQLQNRAELIDRWVEAYPQTLRPKLRPRRFAFGKGEGFWRDQAILKGADVLLGGEPAAELLTGHLRAEEITLYGDTQTTYLAKNIQLRKDDGGPLILLDRFWKFAYEREGYPRHLTPPLLVYADLIRTGDARNLETAKLVQEQYLHD